MKASFPTVSAIVGGVKYDVHLRILPGRVASHAGPESPDYLRPGSPPRISIVRILRDCVDVGSELHWSVRQKIESAVLRMAAEGGASPGAVDVSPSVSTVPSFEDGERFR